MGLAMVQNGIKLVKMTYLIIEKGKFATFLSHFPILIAANENYDLTGALLTYLYCMSAHVITSSTICVHLTTCNVVT
jgi:hypothetical protein